MRTLVLIAMVIVASPALAQKKKPVDLLIYNAHIYTVDAKFSEANAMVIVNGKIEETGNLNSLSQRYAPQQSINALGKFIYPGFIDAHSHFYRYGLGLQEADLVGTRSWAEILLVLVNFSKKQPDGWLVGRGWDQNDWTVKEFPTREQLDLIFPDRPVALSRVDGHALIVNGKALQLAGITAATRVEGGSIEVKDGVPTGVLVDNAMDAVFNKIPAATQAQISQGLLQAQQNCFAVGLTTVDDCGLDKEEVLFIDSMQRSGFLKMRIYAMLSDATPNYQFLFSRGAIKTPRLNVRSFKVYADGALGSRGACLLQPYHDKPGWMGFLRSSQMHFDSVAAIISAHNFQMCTHAIGDSGNRVMLEIYAKYLRGKNDSRWRIEHAQVVNQHDFSLFGQNNIIPSVQPTHATSDMYWAAERLGPDRVKGAYAFKQLMQQNGWIPLGTDFPVEDISPFKTFFAAVVRQDASFFPAGGFQPENALTRIEALRGMTIWAARANFEENEKGSLEPGKLADFVILDKDLMKADVKELLHIKVLSTWQDGKKVYERK